MILSAIEKKLREIQEKIPAKKSEIELIEQKISNLQQKFHHLQSLLTQQIQARYKQQPNQPLAWLFINTQKADMDKLLTYYQYVIHTNAHTLQALKTTRNDLQHQQQNLHQDIQTLHRMEAQAQIAQQQLQAQKNQHQKLLYALQQHVATQEKTLNSYEHNRDNLSRILHKLSQESVIQTRHSMTTMKRKLPTPIAVNTQQIQKLHQGIILYSPEGSAVHAVYPGKVVFCEWLNGYGLLLIIDHGWGLMTLYANNLTLTKQVGDMVNQGEQIATVGHSGISKQPGLYFEVRKQGKAISPLEWLKKGNYHV